MLNYYEYPIENVLGYEDDMLDSLKTDYKHADGYIQDAILDVADNYTPIYYYDMFTNNLRHIIEYCDNAISEGANNFESIVTQGYFLYNVDMLNEGLQEVIANILIDKIENKMNEYKTFVTTEQLENIEKEIDTLYLSNQLYLDKFSEVDELADEIFYQVFEI